MNKDENHKENINETAEISNKTESNTGDFHPLVVFTFWVVLIIIGWGYFIENKDEERYCISIINKGKMPYTGILTEYDLLCPRDSLEDYISCSIKTENKGCEYQYYSWISRKSIQVKDFFYNMLPDKFKDQNENKNKKIVDYSKMSDKELLEGL